MSNLYQLVYKVGSKTHYIELESDSYQKARDLFQALIGGELTDIRKIIHTDKTIKKDDGNYHKSIKIILRRGTNHFQSFKVSKILKSAVLSDQSILDVFTLDGLKAEKVEFNIIK